MGVVKTLHGELVSCSCQPNHYVLPQPWGTLVQKPSRFELNCRHSTVGVLLLCQAQVQCTLPYYKVLRYYCLLCSHDPTPGGPASPLRTTARRKIPQPVSRLPEHHRLSREPVGYLRPVNTSVSMTHDAPVVSERPKPQSASAVPSRYSLQLRFNPAD